MERLSKIAIYLGMAIALSIFVLFVISIMPHTIDQLNREWGDVIPISKEEVMEKFQNTESYKIFNEKYPDNGVYLDLDRNGGRLELTAMNFETFNELRLELRYYPNNGGEDVREEISCSNDLHDVYYQIRGSLASQFIEKVDCLSGNGLVSATSPLVDEDGFPLPIREPSLGGVYNYACGVGTTFDEGICIVD